MGSQGKPLGGWRGVVQGTFRNRKSVVLMSVLSVLFYTAMSCLSSDPSNYTAYIYGCFDGGLQGCGEPGPTLGSTPVVKEQP